jgi:hypothetical protein
MGNLFVWEDVRYSQLVMLNVVKDLIADMQSSLLDPSRCSG